MDNIVGILYAKDLLPYLKGEDDPPPMRTMVRAPLFVPESMHVDDLLHSLQRRKVHIAIVLDEYGGTAGLVTIEDLIEEIVGEIQDEYDVEEPMLVALSADEARLDGRASVDDLAEHFDIDVRPGRPRGVRHRGRPRVPPHRRPCPRWATRSRSTAWCADRGVDRRAARGEGARGAHPARDRRGRRGGRGRPERRGCGDRSLRGAGRAVAPSGGDRGLHDDPQARHRLTVHDARGLQLGDRLVPVEAGAVARELAASRCAPGWPSPPPARPRPAWCPSNT